MTTPIEDDLMALVDAERSRPEAGSADADRVWKGVSARLKGAPPPTSVPAGGGFSMAWLVVVAGVVAVAVGWGAWPRSVESFASIVPRPLPAVVAETVALPQLHASVDVQPELELESPPAPTPSSTRPSTKVRSGTVADELALIEQARSALAKGRPAVALRVLAGHRRSFPRGAFVEEAAALRASALCKAGRIDDARSAAARFRTRWPGSVHAARASGCDEADRP